MNIGVGELLKAINAVCIVGLVYRDMEAFLATWQTLRMFECTKLVVCHSLGMKLSQCTLGNTWSLSPEMEEEKFWSAFCGRVGGCFFSGSASGTSLSCLALGSTVSICQGLGLSLDLRAGSLPGRRPRQSAFLVQAVPASVPAFT